MSFEQSFQYLLGWEGGFGNNVKDPGGPTNLGVIQSEYDTYRHNKGKSPQSVAHITRAEAEDIYRTEYWDATLCEQINPAVANCLFDSDVNSGDRRGVEWLQKAINQVTGRAFIAVDGKASPVMVAAVHAVDPVKLIDAMLDIRLAFMHVARNPKTGAQLWPTFGRGWYDRIVGVRKQSHALAGFAPPKIPLPVQSVSVPKADPHPGDTLMPATVAPVAAAPVAPIVPVMPTVTPAASVTAGLNISNAQVMNAMIGNLMGAMVTIGAPLLGALQGTTTAHYVAAALFGLSGLGSLITNTWGFLNHNSAVSSNTVSAINQLGAIAGQVAGAMAVPQMHANTGVAQPPLSQAAA